MPPRMSRRAEATDAALREINSRIDKLTAALTDVQTTARSAAAGSDRASSNTNADSHLGLCCVRTEPASERKYHHHYDSKNEPLRQ